MRHREGERVIYIVVVVISLFCASLLEFNHAPLSIHPGKFFLGKYPNFCKSIVELKIFLSVYSSSRHVSPWDYDYTFIQHIYTQWWQAGAVSLDYVDDVDERTNEWKLTWKENKDSAVSECEDNVDVDERKMILY